MSKKYFKAEWFWGRETDTWLKKLCIGYTLNFPCGLSQIGHVRADKDKNVKPDIVADIRAFEFSFKEGQFDTVICDPPFSFWALDKVYKWMPAVAALAKKRLVFRCPLVHLKIPHKGWKREYYIRIKPSALVLDMFHVFTNPNEHLSIG